MSTIANEPAITITNAELKILQDMVYLNSGANAYEYNEYVHGVSDGMELVMAYIERREPLFRKSDKGLYRGIRTVREVSYAGLERGNKDSGELKS